MAPLSPEKKRQWRTVGINALVTALVSIPVYFGIGGFIVGLVAMGFALGTAISLLYALFDHTPGK